MTMEDFFVRLRSSTHALHQAVEQTNIAAAIMSPRVSTNTYIEFLSRSFALHDAIEVEIFPQMEHLITDLSSRKKIGSLLEDLKYFEVSPMEEWASLDYGDYRNNTDFNFGLLYVTEGSSLGGLHILKHIRKVLGPGVPGNFLNVYGDKTGTTWKSFMGQLDNYQAGIDEARRKEIIAGAMFGFRWARDIFEKEIA